MILLVMGQISENHNYLQLPRDFLSVAKNLLDRMTNQGGSKQIKKAYNRHPEAFQKNCIMASNIASKIAAT